MSKNTCCHVLFYLCVTQRPNFLGNLFFFFFNFVECHFTNAQYPYVTVLHNIYRSHLFLSPHQRLHIISHRILLLVNISNARRAFSVLKDAVLDSRVGGGQGELVLEAFLNCIFGAELRRSYRGRTAGPVCGGSSDVKVLHCMRQFPNCQPFTGLLMCICMCINSASKSRMKRVQREWVKSVYMSPFNKFHMAVYVLAVLVVLSKTQH